MRMERYRYLEYASMYKDPCTSCKLRPIGRILSERALLTPDRGFRRCPLPYNVRESRSSRGRVDPGPWHCKDEGISPYTIFLYSYLDFLL